MSKARHVDANLRALLDQLDAAFDPDNDDGETMIALALLRDRAKELRTALRRYVDGKTLAEAFGEKRGPKGPRNKHSDTIAAVKAIKAAEPKLGSHKAVKRAGWTGKREAIQRAARRQEKAERKAKIEKARTTLSGLIAERGARRRG